MSNRCQHLMPSGKILASNGRIKGRTTLVCRRQQPFFILPGLGPISPSEPTTFGMLSTCFFFLVDLNNFVGRERRESKAAIWTLWVWGFPCCVAIHERWLVTRITNPFLAITLGSQNTLIFSPLHLILENCLDFTPIQYQYYLQPSCTYSTLPPPLPSLLSWGSGNDARSLTISNRVHFILFFQSIT